ncbi:Glycosyl transferase, group 1 [Thiocapsa sp. KS1]|nr:glycosyltransferase [Thiocapsa sp. KS1]CRI64449.1 Glycosyl transferase, group 1 [Thiocapsa sp. KS1]
MRRPDSFLKGALEQWKGAVGRGVRSLYRLLPLGDVERGRIKTAVHSVGRPFARLLGSREPEWSKLVPDWDGSWSSLFPPVESDARRLLVIDWKPPTPDRDSGSFRMRMILELMSEDGWVIDFIGDRRAEDLSYEASLQELGIPVIIGQEAAFRHLTHHGSAYRTVWISRPEIAERYLPMVRALAVQAWVIYDTVDLHWIRLRRGMPFSDTPEVLRVASERYRAIELCNARCSDLTIAITDDERAALQEASPGLAVAVLPNIHRVCLHVAPVSTRSDLFFIGSFNHPPNVDAVIYFAHEIFPLILQQLPDVRFHIAGSDMPYSVRALKSRRIDPIGFVRDVTPWFQRARVFVAPLRHGAGMKGKVGQSLAFGLPVVTTRVGAEGMGLTHEINAMIADDRVGFAEAVIRLYSDDRLWLRLSSAGRELVGRSFSREAVRRVLTPVLGSNE